MIETGQLMCCGVLEVSNVQNTVNDLGVEGVIGGISADAHPFVVLTGVVYKGDDRACGEVAAYIAQHRLGAVTVTPTAAPNPNSGNSLKVWVWKINKVNLRKWRAAHRSIIAKLARRGY